MVRVDTPASRFASRACRAPVVAAVIVLLAFSCVGEAALAANPSPPGRCAHSGHAERPHKPEKFEPTGPAVPDVPLPFRMREAGLEPVDWSQLDGWAADDHAAAFSTFLVSCRPIAGTAHPAGESRPMYAALHAVCGRALKAGTLDDAAAAAQVLRRQLPPGPHREARRCRRLPHGLLRADRRWLALSDADLSRADLSAAARPAAARRHVEQRGLSQYGPVAAAGQLRQARAVLRPRPDRGRCARWTASRAVLDQGRDRGAVYPDPGFGAHPARGRPPAAHQLRQPQRLSLPRRSAAS